VLDNKGLTNLEFSRRQSFLMGDSELNYGTCIRPPVIVGLAERYPSAAPLRGNDERLAPDFTLHRWPAPTCG